MPIYKGTSNTSIICPDRIKVCGGLFLLILVNLVPISPLRLGALENQKIKKMILTILLIKIIKSQRNRTKEEEERKELLNSQKIIHKMANHKHTRK